MSTKSQSSFKDVKESPKDDFQSNSRQLNQASVDYMNAVANRPLAYEGFLTLFSIISALPVFFFSLFTLATTIVFGTAASLFAFFWITLFVSIAGSALAAVLVAAAGLSMFIGNWGAATYLGYRFVTNLHQLGLSQGLREFDRELRSFFFKRSDGKPKGLFFDTKSNGTSI